MCTLSPVTYHLSPDHHSEQLQMLWQSKEVWWCGWVRRWFIERRRGKMHLSKNLRVDWVKTVSNRPIQICVKILVKFRKKTHKISLKAKQILDIFSCVSQFVILQQFCSFSEFMIWSLLFSRVIIWYLSLKWAKRKVA